MKQTNIRTRSGLALGRETLQEFGNHSIFIGDYTRTQRHYEKAAALNTNKPVIHLGLFQASCHIGSFAKIIHTIEMYLKMHSNDSDALFSCSALPKKTRKYSGYKSPSILPDDQDAKSINEIIERNLAQKYRWSICKS